MEALQRLHNRGSVSTGYDIDNSVKLERDNTEGFTFTNSSAGNRKTWTISYWFKRTEIYGGYDIIAGANTGLEIGFDSNDRFQVYDGGYLFVTNRKFRDASAFYHIVVQLDTTQSTASNRIKLYVNGVEETSLATDAPPSQNADLKWNNTGLLFYVGYFPSANYYSNGYLADVYSIDGQAVAPTEFGEFDEDTGIWKPKRYAGSYGTNGFKLEFKNSSALNTDTSGNSKSISLTNVTAADQATDTPTNNFATMNVLWGNDRMPLMSEGATEIGNNVSAYRYAPATMGVTSGKWYWEIKPTVNGNTLVSGAGIASNQTTLYFYDVTGNFVYHYDGDRYVNGSAVSSYGAAWATNNILGFAYDADNWTLTCYVNNSSQGNLLASQTDISSELFIPYVYSFGTHTYQTNFGGYTTMSNTHTNTDENGYGSFVYAPPTGYYAMCTKNLEEYG